MTGAVPSKGSVRLGDRELSGLPVAARQRLGLSRSFQSLELFSDLTVLDNLKVASEPTVARDYLTELIWPRRSKLSAETLAAIDEFGLHDDLHRYPRELTYGKRRLVAIARAVASGSPVLLLDEPAARLDESRKPTNSVRSSSTSRATATWPCC